MGHAQAVGGEVEAAVQAAEKDSDRALLKLYQAALKGGKLARALEAAAQLALPAALNGALTLANRLGCANSLPQVMLSSCMHMLRT